MKGLTKTKKKKREYQVITFLIEFHLFGCFYQLPYTLQRSTTKICWRNNSKTAKEFFTPKRWRSDRSVEPIMERVSVNKQFESITKKLEELTTSKALNKLNVEIIGTRKENLNHEEIHEKSYCRIKELLLNLTRQKVTETGRKGKEK